MHPSDKDVGFLYRSVVPPLNHVRLFVVHFFQIDHIPSRSIFRSGGDSPQQRRVAIADDVAFVGQKGNDVDRAPDRRVSEGRPVLVWKW